jgi:glycosyltransferase involved in cell wall biosynthesis
MKLGIIANEFFDHDIGRMGGFGWAARQVATFFKSQPHLGVTVVFLAGSLHSRKGLSHTRVHDTPLLFRSNGAGYRNALLEQKLDLLLTIDYRPDYRDILHVLGRTSVIVWVRDPKPPHVLAKQNTLRIPGEESACPRGTKPIDCTSLSSLVNQHTRAQRHFLFAAPAPSLSCLIESTYRVSGVTCAFLPNIVDLEARVGRKSDQPRVIFLGRLDPIKRPWLFVELGRRFPRVEFLMLGQSHF